MGYLDPAVEGPPFRQLFVVALLLANLGVPLSDASAQRLTAGSTPAGVELIVVDQAYAISGNTARALLDQMRGARWTRYRYWYEWTYRTVNAPTAFGLRSDKCIADNLEIRVTVEPQYPRWTRTSEAPERLVAAWDAFEAQIVAQWEEQQRAMIDFARDVDFRVQRLEEDCPVLRQLTDALIRRRADARDRAMEERYESGDFVQLRWPPEGYEDLLAPTGLANEGRRPAPLPPSDRRPVERPVGSGFDGAARGDMGAGGMTGVVVALQRVDETVYLEAFGSADREGEEPLTPDGVFRFPGFAEVVVARVAEVLDREGSVDLEEPLAAYLPELDERLGSTTLAQLLSHRAGLDDANPRDSLWSEILDALNDRAVFTEPGAVHSYSRYSYPLAVRALERAAGEDVAGLAARTVFEPLGMESTSLDEAVEGLPVARTTAPDLLRFATAWIEGRVGYGVQAEAGARYLRGFWSDTVGGQARVSLMCAADAGGDAVAVQIFPESGVSFVVWSRPQSSLRRWPEVSVRFLMDRVGDDLGVGAEIFEPRPLRGDAQLERSSRPCEQPDWNTLRVSDPGVASPPGDWVGQYSNGDRIVTLRERDGSLRLEGSIQLDVTHYSQDTYFATLAGRPMYPIRLTRDAAGRRYAVLGERAHLHADDRSRN